MIKIRQYIPGWVDGPVPKVTQAVDTASLLAVPWIARWGGDDLVCKDGATFVQPFHRFTVADKGTTHESLMAEFDGGRHCWVIGEVLEGSLDLPEWVEHPEARASRERWKRGIIE